MRIQYPIFKSNFQYPSEGKQIRGEFKGPDYPWGKTVGGGLGNKAGELGLFGAKSFRKWGLWDKKPHIMVLLTINSHNMSWCRGYLAVFGGGGLPEALLTA